MKSVVLSLLGARMNMGSLPISPSKINFDFNFDACKSYMRNLIFLQNKFVRQFAALKYWVARVLLAAGRNYVEAM